MIIPGVNFLGGSNGWKGGVFVCWDAIDKWEKDFGWKDQHHLFQVSLHTLKENWYTGIVLLGDLMKRIIDGGGRVQAIIWGTPKELASVPVSWRENGRTVYQKHPPNNYDKWTDIYINVVSRLVNKCGTENSYFNIWHEPSRWSWRSSDKTFFDFYGVVQKGIAEYQKRNKISVNFGGVQVSDLRDHYVGAQSYTSTPTMEWIENWFYLILKNNWQVNFVDLFQYDDNVNFIINKIKEIENLMNDYNVAGELFFNCISPGPHIRHDEEEASEYTLKLAKKIMTETSVNAANYDFLEDVTRDQLIGLLKWGTLKERPRWQVVRKIVEWNE